MKNFSVFICSLALAGSFVILNGCASKSGTNGPAITSDAGTLPGVKIAYVNIDSFASNYNLLKKKSDGLNDKEAQMKQELQQSYQQMQSKSEALQKKAQTENMSQSEAEAAQKQLLLMQQSLESRQQSMSDQLMKEREDLQHEIKGKLDSFLTAYNKDKHFDYILSYSASGGSAILLANKQLDITKDVIDGMNALSKGEADSKKK